MDEEIIAQLEVAWQEEQSRLWREFRESLTPEQEAIFKTYRRATATLAKLRRWRSDLKRSKSLRGKPVPWPGE